jgi:hypothetical protein
MGKKGLCVTCVNDKDCTFPRRFPVLQCEEFSGYKPAARINNSSAVKCSKRRETRCVDIETTESFE